MTDQLGPTYVGSIMDTHAIYVAFGNTPESWWLEATSHRFGVVTFDGVIGWDELTTAAMKAEYESADTGRPVRLAFVLTGVQYEALRNALPVGRWEADMTDDERRRMFAAKRLRAKEAAAQARRDAAHGPAMRARIALLEERLTRLVDAMHLRRHTLTDAERVILDDATEVLP